MEIINNIFFYNITFQSFLEKNPEIPICQREYIDERINYFYDKIKDKEPNDIYLGIINCAFYDNHLFILDGQHRYYAYKKYYNEKNNKSQYQCDELKISYIVKTCNSKKELTDFFKDLNDHYNLEDIILDNFDIADILKKHIKNKYKTHISNSEKPIYPNINIDKLIKLIIERNKNPIGIIDYFEKLNQDIYEIIKNDDKYSGRNHKQGLYLAYLFQSEKESKNRTKLPASVRNKLWTNFFNDNKNGICQVCKTNINDTNFHAGHIISVKNGGTDKINNLIPICSCCNLSMGTMNLLEYKNKYF